MTPNDLPDAAKPKVRDGRRRNHLTHGLRASTLGRLPKGASYAGKLLHEFRRQLEAVVMEAKGKITFTDSCSINTAARWERHALLAGRWLNLHAETMNHDQRLAYSAAVGKASEARDKAIAALKLQQEPASIVATLRAIHSEPKVTDIDGGASHGH